MLVDLLMGGIAGTFSRTMVAPLELFRIQRQADFIPNSSLRAVYNKEGMRYFWKGNMANCSRIFPQMAINFAVFNNTKHMNKQLIKDNEQLSNFISGAMGGSISMAITYPLETTRTYLCLQTNKSKYKGINDVLMKTPTKQIYQGLGVSMGGFALWSGIQYSSFFWLRDNFKDTYFDSKLLLGGLSGCIAITISYPTDLLRRRLQLQGFDKSVPKYNNVFHGIYKILRTDGVRGMYKGLTANYIKTFPQTALQFWALGNLNLLLKNENI